MYSEKKDTREGLSGECLTKSALSFDDSTKRKSLPFDVNLSSFSDHTIQDFDDFDFVGLDYGAWMLPNLKYELDSSREKPLVDFDDPNIKAHGLLVSNSEEKNTREASTRQCMTESVCSLVDSMPSISSTDFDALDNRSHLGRAYQSGPIVFNSEQKDTREGLSGQWLTKSAPSFDDKQKLLSDVRILASSLELTSQDLYDIGDFDDFDGFDHCAGRLPNLEDETSHSSVGHLSTKLRLVRCPKCRQVLPEPANIPVYMCGGCNTVLQAKKHKNDQDKCSLKHNNGGDPNEYAQSNGKYIGGVNLLEEVASPMEPNHHKSAESEVDKSGNCLEEENGGVNFSDEVASLTELNHLGSEESSPVAGAPSNYMREELHYRTSLHSPNKPEKNYEEEKMELLERVSELQDQLNRTRNSLGVGPEVDMCPRSCHQGRRWPHQNRTSRIPFSAEAKMSRYQVDKSCFHCCSHDWMSSAPLRPHLFCNKSQHKAHQSPIYSSLYSSTLSSPQYRTSSEFSLQSYDPNSDDRELKKYYWERNRLKRHVRPVAGGAPFVICYRCSELLQLPSDFLIPKRRFHKLMCSACSNILKFSLEDGTRLFPYADDYTPDAVAPPLSEVDDYGPSLAKKRKNDTKDKDLQKPDTNMGKKTELEQDSEDKEARSLSKEEMLSSSGELPLDKNNGSYDKENENSNMNQSGLAHHGNEESSQEEGVDQDKCSLKHNNGGDPDEYAQSNGKYIGGVNLLDEVASPMEPNHHKSAESEVDKSGNCLEEERLVRCPKCLQLLREPANIPVYQCGGCNTVLRAKKHKNDQDKCSLKHNNGGDPNEYAQSNGKYIGGVNLFDEVASPTEPNHHKSAESEVDTSGNCLEEENGGVNFSDEVASSTELNHLGSEESSPVAGAHSEVDENKNCLEQEVVSSTELNNNEIEVSSPVVRAYSEANEHGICNGKQTGGVNISDEVVSSTELNDNEIKVSSPVVVTAHSEANEHKTCMEQNNGMNQGEFGDFKLGCSKNTKSSGEISSSTELTCQEIEESTPVIETNAQLKKLFTRRLTLEFEERLDDFMATIRRRDCREPMMLETIKTPVMDPGNEDVISDFMTFVNGKKFYKRKGKTWKRGYLLYEPPGSDGASLIAAMADFLEFKLYNLDLASFSSFSELKNTLLVGTWSSSVIAIRDLVDFEHCAGMLPNLKNELTGSCLLEFVNGLLSSCSDEQIIVFTTNNRDHHDAARRRRFNEDIYIHKSSPQPVALADEGEIVQLDSSRQKPLVDFEATNIKAYQSSLLVSNSEEKNMREASTRRCMTESACSFVDSMTSISSTDFDALDNRAHLGRAYQSGPIVFNSEKKDTREGLNGECLTKSALSFDDSTKRKSLPFDVNLSSSEHASQDFDDFDFVGFDCGSGMLPNLKDELDSSQKKPLVDFDAPNIKAHGLLVSNSEEKNMREASRRQCMPEGVLSLVDSGATRISSTDFDAPDNSAHLVRAYKSGGPIVFDSEKEDMEEIDSSEHKPLVDFDATSNRTYKSRVLVSNSEKKNTRGASKRQCMTKSVPSFDALDNRAHLVGAHQSTSSMELEQPENEGIISDLLGFLRDKEFYKRIGKAWKRGYLLYDSPCTDRSSLIAAMANCLKFDIYDLNLTGVSSISELTNVLVPIRNRSVIAIKDFDRWFAMLPSLKNELTISGLFKIIDGFLSSCGDEQIIVLTTNHNHIDRFDAALLRPLRFDLYIHKSSPQPKALPDGGEIVLLDSSEQKPSADFDATNNRACQSDILVSSSEEKNMREASRRQCMPEGVLSLVDSGATRISLTDFDAPDNSAHLVRAYKNGPIVFNSEKEDMGEELNRECFTKSILTFDDSSVQKSLSDVDVTENKSHLVRAYLSGSFMSLSDNKNRGDALKRKCITKSILGLEDLQPISRDRRDDAAMSFCGIHTTYSLAPISFEVLETLPTREKPNDCVPLLSLGRLTLEVCVQQEKSPDLPRATQINGVEQRETKMPRYLGGLTPQSASSSRWPIGLPDGGHIDLLDPFVQFATNIEHAARADQCSPTESCAEKKMVRKTLKRMCRTMSVIFEENHQHFARRCKGTTKSLGAMRIFRKHGINQVSPVKRIHKQHGVRQWPFRQKWATRKGYSLGDERPFEVSSLYMDEKLDSRLQFIHMSKFARSSPRALTLPDGGEIVGPVALSSSEFAATNNRAHLVEQDQSSSTAPHYECKNTRETSDKQGLEDLKRHFVCKDKDAVKSLGVSVSMFKSTCRQHWVYCWPGQFENNDESGPTVSNSEKGSTREGLKRDCLTNALSLEDLRQHFGARHKDAAEGLCDSPAWMSFEVLDSLPLGERSNSIRYLAWRRTLTHKHCVRLKKSQDLLRSLQRDCSGGLAPQSDIGLLDGGHILSLSEKKIVRKTLKRKCRTMSVLSLEDHQHHVGWRWEDAVKFLGTKRICRQLAIHCETTVKRIHRQLGTRRWPFKQTAIGLSDGGHILSLSEKKIVRKTLKRKCRSMSLLSLEDHKQHVDGRWEDAAKSHGAKRICRQLVIHRLSTAKRIRKQHGIHRWPFQRSAVGLPDGHILPLSEKKIVRTTLKRKCRSMSVHSLVDRQQHVDRRWEDAAMNIGAKRIYRQLVIHCVSIAKRIYRQHGIYHRWPFEQDWTKMKGYSLGDERPIEVISLSMHVKLVPRLQLIYISWLGRFSPRPSALAGGGEIGGPIALSLSESAATKNIAQHVGQDQSGSAASDSENERTREQGDPEEINATITLHDIRRHYSRRNREDAAASLAISVSTFKRKCREYGIKRWPHVRKRKVGRPPDQHGEGNTSTARETPLHYVQTGMEGELVGQNELANVFQRDFMGGPIALNTESGLIMVSRPPDQHGERNTSTACGTPSRNVETGMEVEPVGQNQEANVFQRDFMYGPIALNTDGLTFPECSDAVAPSQPMATILDTIPHLNGDSSECAFQVKNQSTQFTANPYPNGLVDPHPQIALTETLSENMERLEDRRNLLAPRKEPLPEGHVFGSVNWTVHSCSNVALSQPMPTIPHTTGCSEYWRNSLALLEEHLLEENDYGSINLTAPSCFDPGPSQPMHTIPHTMPTIPVIMPLLTERQDMRSVRLKATYGNTTIKFPLPSGFSELKEEVSKRLEFEHGSFKLEYKDEEGDSVLIACDEDVRDYLRLLTSLGNQVVKLFVLDKVPNTTNFCDNCGCDNCRSLKCKRP